MTDKRVQSPRWISLALQVLEGKADNHRSLKSNNDTIRLTKSYIKILLDGLALSEAQTTALVTNIRNRVPGRADFTWEGGPVKLTAKQLDDAKANPKYAAIIAEFNEVNSWRAHVHSVLDSKLREIEADCADVAEYQLRVAGFYDFIKRYDG